MHVKIKIAFTSIFLTATTFLHAQQAKDSLDAQLARASYAAKTPGFAAVIVNKNGIVYQKNLGYANVAARSPYTLQTTENIGSVSKTFIATALMKAIDLGYFKLETPINDILPFKVVNPYFPGAMITVQQLATHTSGIIDNDSIYPRSYKFRVTGTTSGEAVDLLRSMGYSRGLADTTLSTFLRSYLAAGGRLYDQKNFYNSQPGKRSSYSNIASALAAYLIEVKSHMSFAAFSEKYILRPLQMTHSGWSLEAADMRQHAIPYATADLPLPFYTLTTYPDGGLISSAADMSKFVMEMIRTVNKHSRLLSQQSAAVMFTPAFSKDSLPQNISLTRRNKGIFWNLYVDGYIGHDGDDPGVSTNILFNGEYGIIFMTNMYVEDRSPFLDALKAYVHTLPGQRLF